MTPPGPRRKIPFWAMPVLVALPLWAYVYQGTLSPPPAGDGPRALGEELYVSAGCAGCHGADGAGSGTFPGFADGRIYETWPSFLDHFEWVRLGSTGWLAEHGATYGGTGKQVQGDMPGFGEEQLTDAELIAIVLHERLLGGANPDAQDMVDLEAVATLLWEDDGMTLGDALESIGAEVPTAETAE